jgi:hypothetical protein
MQTMRPIEFRRIVLVLSGAREEILAQCPTERGRFENLGWAILITSGMATVSMWFALSSAMGINGIIAVVPAVGWGLVIMGIDRWLITSMPVGSRRKFLIAAPRLLLAILLGTLISTPLVLRVFESEINAQISAIKQQRYSTFLQQQQNSPVAKQVASARNQVASWQKVIDTHGAAAAPASADPQLKGLNSQLGYWQSQERYYYQQWQCQLYGGTGCTKKGNGPLAQAMQSDYQQAKGEVAKVQGEITQRNNQLAATGMAEEQARYNQALTALPGAQQQLKVAQARLDTLQANYYAQNQATNGILIRLQALSQLSNDDFTVTAARFLLFLLFLVIECLPVTVKILQQPGNYEKILRAEQESELRAARRKSGSWPRPGSDGVMVLPPGAGAMAPVMAPSAQRRVNVRAIWQPTKVLPRPHGDPEDQWETGQWGTEDGRETEPLRHQSPVRDDWEDPLDEEMWRPPHETRRAPHAAPPDAAPPDAAPPGQTRSDQIRYDYLPVLPVDDVPGMSDDRVSANPDGHSRDIPLRWDDE